MLQIPTAGKKSIKSILKFDFHCCLTVFIFTVFAVRRNSILIVNCLSVVGACLMSASKVCKSFEVLILGRLVFGLFCGLVMSLNPLYIQEVSPTNLRGAFATLNQVSFAAGILVGMVRMGKSSVLFMLAWRRSHCTLLHMDAKKCFYQYAVKETKRCSDCGRPSGLGRRFLSNLSHSVIYLSLMMRS